MIKDYFLPQIGQYPTITEEVLEKIEYRVVWSGNRMQVGDVVVYAFVYVPNTDDLKIISFLERELDEIDKRFNFVKYENETIPVLTFKEDLKKRDE